MKEEDKKVWTAAKVECNLCNHIWIAVYHIDSNELECPNCENMNLFNVIESIKQDA